MAVESFEHFPGAVLLVETDGVIVEVNEWLCKRYKIRRQDILGKNLREFVETDEYREVAVSGKPQWGETRLHWKGEIRTLFYVVVQVPDEESQLAVMLLELGKTAKNPLLDQLEATMGFLDSFRYADIGFMVVDERGRYVHANDVLTKFTGIALKDSLGQKVGFSRPGYKPLIFEAMVREEVLKEVRPITSANETRYFDITAIPIFRHGKVIGGFSIITDVTGRIKLERKLIDSERMFLVGEMAARIMHDIRNPLQIVKSSVQIMNMWNDKGAYDPERVRAMLGNVDTAVNSVIELMNDLLQFSKPATEKMEPMNMKELLARLAGMLSSTFNKYQIQFTLDVDDNCEIIGNRKLIRQAALNIIQNAVEVLQEFNGERKLVIRCMEGADKVFLEIFNAGPVIDEAIITKIFDTFFSTKGTKGTGLGLAITKEIVETHKGRIQCVSTLENKGTSFLMEFPKASAQATAESEVAAVERVTG